MPEKVFVRMDGREILYSGAFVASENSTISISVRDLSINITFKTTQSEEPPEVIADGNGKPLNLILNDFNDAMGITYDSPIGHLDKRQLFLSLYCQAVIGERQTTRFITVSLSLAAAKLPTT